MITISWGSIYLGLKKEWMSVPDFFDYCNTGMFSCNDDRLAELYMAFDNSFVELLELIKRYIVLDNEPPIIWNEDTDGFDFSVIDSSFWEFWELKFLLEIIDSEKTREEKLNSIAILHLDFEYKESWFKFINYMPTPDGIPIGISGLYKNLLEYISFLREKCKS